MRVGLRALRVATPALDRLGLRAPAEKVISRATREGFKTFRRVPGIGAPARQKPASPGDDFDLTPTDEQAMLVEALRDFAAQRLRPLARDADAACAPPDDLKDEIGVALLGVPETLGGLTEERSTVTAVLAGEALAHGDLGLATALLAPAGVATALARFGDASQQATYLPAFTGEDVAPAALAILEPHPLFDPFDLKTTATNNASTVKRRLSR
jgi:alkylation response protein AidB-like acyl-CoA dehydrogenase